jgi:hypothetical protein
MAFRSTRCLGSRCGNNLRQRLAAGNLNSLTRLVSNHFVGILVFPNSKKDRLTKAIIPRPFREFYLADHYGFNPMATFHFGGA